MKKILVIFVAIVFYTVIPAKAGIHPDTQVPTILAATSTPSAIVATASATPIITPSEAQDIQEKIKTLVKENLTATESNLKEKINLQTLVGYVGKINSINSGNLVIDSKEATLIQITTNEKTEFIKAGTTTKMSSLALADKVIVIGPLLKDDIIQARRVVVVADEPNLITTSTTIGKISALDPKKKTISLIIKDKEVVFGLTKKSTIKFDELKIDQTIFAITKKYDGKDLLSRAKII